MAIRTIREEGDEILRKNSKIVKEITPRTDELIDDMIETLHVANGVGLAAVQVGVLKRLCVISIDPYDMIAADEDDDLSEIDFEAEFGEDFKFKHTDGEDIVIINPQIEVLGEETQTGNEGCLSLPGKFGMVTRPDHIMLRAFDRNLAPYELEAKGLLARAICHECDHMDGILYTDKVEGEVFDASLEESEE